MKKKIAAIVAVLLILGGAAAAFFFLFKKRTAAGTLGLIPRNAIVVIEVDFAAAKTTAEQTSSLLSWAKKMQSADPRMAAQMAVFERIQSDCGLDWQKSFTSIAGAMLPPMSGSKEPQGLLIVNGNFSVDQLTKCIGVVGNSIGQPAAPGNDIEGHKTFYPGNAPSIPREPARDYRIVVMDKRIVLASVATLPDLFKVFDGKADSAAKNDVLREARAALGNNPGFDILFDVSGFSQTFPREWGRLTSQLARNAELSGFLSMVTSVQSISIGFSQDGAGIHAGLVTRHNDAKQASETTSVLQGLWALGKTAAKGMIVQAQSRLAVEAARDPTLAAKVPLLTSGFTLANTLMDKLTIKNDNKNMRVELDISTTELKTFQEFVQVVFETLLMSKRSAPAYPSAYPSVVPANPYGTTAPPTVNAP